MNRRGTHLVLTFVDNQVVLNILVRLPYAQDNHVFAVGVLVVSDVSYGVKGKAREHSLLLLVCDLYAVL